METNGKVKTNATSIGPASGSFKRVVAIKLEVSRIMMIKIAFIASIKVAADVKMRILRPLFSATSLDIDIGIAKVAIVRSRE